VEWTQHRARAPVEAPASGKTCRQIPKLDHLAATVAGDRRGRLGDRLGQASQASLQPIVRQFAVLHFVNAGYDKFKHSTYH
jgi:hypothetical protein